MFCCSCLGNLTQVVTILTMDRSAAYLRAQLPYLLAYGVPFFVDLCVLGQFWAWRETLSETH